MSNNSAMDRNRQTSDKQSQAAAASAECACEAGEKNHSSLHPPVKEIGGPKGPEPTRYGDWEKGGRCIDF